MPGELWIKNGLDENRIRMKNGKKLTGKRNAVRKVGKVKKLMISRTLPPRNREICLRIG